MKLILSLLVSLLVVSQAFAERVSGYYRKNGTYVESYDRTPRDSNPYNNYSTPGNYNPNTGKITGGNLNTYLDNYNNKKTNSYDSNPYGLNDYNKKPSNDYNYGY